MECLKGEFIPNIIHFLAYTSDLPQTPGDIINVAYGDDITQIIMNNTVAKRRLQIKTQRQIQRIND